MGGPRSPRMWCSGGFGSSGRDLTRWCRVSCRLPCLALRTRSPPCRCPCPWSESRRLHRRSRRPPRRRCPYRNRAHQRRSRMGSSLTLCACSLTALRLSFPILLWHALSTPSDAMIVPRDESTMKLGAAMSGEGVYLPIGPRQWAISPRKIERVGGCPTLSRDLLLS